MAVCKYCGCEFDLSHARRIIGRMYGPGTYNDQYPDGDVCEDCAENDLGAAIGTWNDMRTLPGDWDDD